ncbi:MAG: CO dehydrogenase/CO-methylating acetyl-CoA synthase complex subunit beta, partial [Candidatus Syntrophonatronum acetioxidans]
EIYKDAEEAIKDNPPTRLFQRAINGAIIACGYAEILLSKALADYGPDAQVGYPDTAYYLPVIRSLSGEEVTQLGQLQPILNRMRAQVKESEVTFEMARLAGETTAYAAEIIETVHYLRYGHRHVEPWTGFIKDPIMRKYGILLVDWTIPGEGVIVGKAKTSEDLGNIARELMSLNIKTFFCNEVCEQALEVKVKAGKENCQFLLGNFTQLVHAFSYNLRAAMAFGGIEPGLRDHHRDYQRRRIRAFVLHLGEIDDVQVAAHFAAIFLGFPVICDTELPEDHQVPGWYESHPDYETLVKYAMEVRGLEVEDIEVSEPLVIGSTQEEKVIAREGKDSKFKERVQLVLK